MFYLCIQIIASENSHNEVQLKHHSEEKKDSNFDIFIFTLHWPYTTCYDWKESGKNHKCRDIDNPSHWSVHGLWPTRYHQIAPNFCDNSWHYDHDKMEAIWDDLTTYWPDVEMRDVKDSLWSHEWKKHGTCAVEANDTTMASQTEYFRTGCRLASQNPLVDWLGDSNVVPSDDVHYNTKQVWDAVVDGTGGFRPHIDCIKVDGQAFISEIKVCYDKNLQRTNCDGIVSFKMANDMMGTCLRYEKTGFLYPASSDPQNNSAGGAGNNAKSKDGSESEGIKSGDSTLGLALGLSGAGLALLAVGYYAYRRNNRRSRGYESL